MLTVRAATHADLQHLHPVIERAYRGESARQGWSHEADLVTGPRTDLATLEAILADPAQRLLVAEEDGRIIGCVQLTDRGTGLAYLGLLCVEPGLQGGGHGKAILAAAERVAGDELHAAIVEMTVIDCRAELIAYYERRGYARTGEARQFPVPCDPPLSMIVLAKSLGPATVNLDAKFALIDEHWRPKVAGRLNGQEVKLVKTHGVFPWHVHADADEMFLVWKGRFRVEFRDHVADLGPGEMVIVPRGVEHRTASDAEAEVLIFEPAEVRNTGDVVDPVFTAPNGVSI